jgi:hypothetical protein
MKAITLSGKAFKATAYNTSTVTLATRSGKPDEVPWHDLGHLIGDDGLERHREVMHGVPVIIVQSPPDPRWQTYQGEAQEPRGCAQNDFDDAVALIDTIDNEDARVAVCAALAVCFEGEAKMGFWRGLTTQQKNKLFAKS